MVEVTEEQVVVSLVSYKGRGSSRPKGFVQKLGVQPCKLLFSVVRAANDDYLLQQKQKATSVGLVTGVWGETWPVFCRVCQILALGGVSKLVKHLPYPFKTLALAHLLRCHPPMAVIVGPFLLTFFELGQSYLSAAERVRSRSKSPLGCNLK